MLQLLLNTVGLDLDRFSIFNINPKAFHISCINLLSILACFDCNDHTTGVIYLFNQKKLKE